MQGRESVEAVVANRKLSEHIAAVVGDKVAADMRREIPSDTRL